MKTNIIIKFAAFYLLCICASALAKLPPTHDRVVKPDPVAVGAATGFLTKIDAGSYASAYEQLTARVRRGGSSGEQRILDYLRTRREPTPYRAALTAPTSFWIMRRHSRARLTA